MSWQVEFRAGVWLPQLGWWLDAHFGQERCFVSHAHSDHIAPHRELLCSTGTSRLLQARLPGTRVEHALPFGHTELLTPDTAVTLHPAGHIHGSAQCLLEHAHLGSLLYTGDFKLRPGRSAEPCATPPADLLIMETTFGRPQYVFPPTTQVLAEISAFCHATIEDGETPVLFGYSLGKSQELLCGLAEARLPVMLHPQTLRLTRIYEELGIVFPAYRAFVPGESAGHVVICPPQSGSSAFLRKIGPRRTAVVTGWALDPGAIYRYQCDAAFPLSDHADFPDLLRFVEAVGPRRVLTLHGFAQDFAATLRARGIEAWAVGAPNQLELGLGARSIPVGAPNPGPARPEPTDAEAFAHFAAVAEKVRATPSRREKVSILSAYLRTLPEESGGLAAQYFLARPLSQGDGRTLGLGWAALKRAVLTRAQVTEAEYRAAPSRFADAGDATEALLAARPPSGAPASLTDLAEFLSRAAAARGPVEKLAVVERFLERLEAREAKYLVKLITGDLRIGLRDGLVEEAIAAATGQPIDDVRQAQLLGGDIATTWRGARSGSLRTVSLRLFHPAQFMLASPEPTADAILARLPAPVWLEEKYDGIRCQVHKQGNRVEFFSRDLNRITAQFPDLIQAALALPADFVADAELLAWQAGRALPFADLQRRLGRAGADFFLGAEVPVAVLFFDLLWIDGEPLLHQPLAARRRRLEELLRGSLPARIHLAPVQTARTAEEIEAAFLAARQRGNEGLMAKDPQSPYQPGRRGFAWLKLKKALATLDVVVVAAEYGHGRRRDVLSDYTFAVRDPAAGRFLTIGKAYTGLTDAEIAALTEHFLAQTIEVRGRLHRVVPDTVLEIAFDSIQPSPRHDSGFALRFPRIVRLRPDKPVAEIDTLDTCRRLANTPPFPQGGENSAP